MNRSVCSLLHCPYLASDARPAFSGGRFKDLHGTAHLADDIHLKRAALQANLALDAVRSLGRKGSIELPIELL